MNKEQMAHEIQGVVGKLMVLEVEAWELEEGSEATKDILRSTFQTTRDMLCIVGRMVEPPLEGVPLAGERKGWGRVSPP